MPQVRGTVLKWRSSDGDELKQAKTHAAGNIRGELEAARLQAPFKQALQARFVNRQVAAPKAADPVFVNVDAQRPITGLGQARRGNQSHVT